MSGRISSDLLLYQQTSYKKNFISNIPLCENEEVNTSIAACSRFFGTSCEFFRSSWANPLYSLESLWNTSMPISVVLASANSCWCFHPNCNLETKVFFFLIKRLFHYIEPPTTFESSLSVRVNLFDLTERISLTEVGLSQLEIVIILFFAMSDDFVTLSNSPGRSRLNIPFPLAYRTSYSCSGKRCDI